MKSPEKLIEYIAEDAKLSLGKIQQTATRDGKTEWRLDAISARYLEDDRQVQLDELVVTFFMDSGQEVQLSATDGVLNTETNDIEVSGEVKISNREYTLKTTRLQYQHENRVIFSTAPVVIHRRVGGQLSADALHLDLEANKLLLKGNVRGEFPEQQPGVSPPG
jgi:LPS export ABC transporter protein LptC